MMSKKPKLVKIKSSRKVVGPPSDPKIDIQVLKTKLKLKLKSDPKMDIQEAIAHSLNNQGPKSFSKIAQSGHKYSIIKFCSKIYVDPYDETKLRINLEVEDIGTGEIHSAYMAHGVVTTLQRILKNLTKKYGYKVDLKSVTGLVVSCTGFHEGSGKLAGQQIATLEYEVGAGFNYCVSRRW